MSTTIDNRVVEMRFDNKQFENNVSTTMSSLDKLKSKLDFSGTAKCFDTITNNSQHLGDTVKNVGTGFLDLAKKAAQIQIVTNLVNDLTASVKNLANQFSTMAAMKSGFNEYELKMGSIQTIMAGTGESLETVNKYLDELNTYSDRTIYSFADMTNNIGKFTNAGVKLEDAVTAIKGISNEAAVSGANANEASRAMYNFAQALSSGYVKLIDWKSIENANMATVEFKRELIKTAVELGVLTESAEGLYEVVNAPPGKNQKTSFDAIRNFNDSLSDQWMTTDVLVKTLGKYADETTELGKKAYASAQDIKTFSMMVDTLVEAMQSGWAQSFQIIIGDFNEAKALFTSVGGYLGDMIGKMSDSRNSLLQGWKDLGGRDTLINSLKNAFNALLSIITPIKEAFRSIFPKKSANELHMMTLRFERFTKGLKLGGLQADKLKSVFVSVFTTMKNVFKAIGAVIKPVSAGLKDVFNIFGEDIALKNIIRYVANFSKSLIISGDTAKNLSSIIRHLGRGISDVFSFIASYAKPIGEAIEEMFPTDGTVKGFLGFISNALKLFRNLIKSITLTSKSANVVKDVFVGIFSIFKMVGQAISGLVKGFVSISNSSKKLTIFETIGKKTSDFAKFLSELSKTDKVSSLFEKAGSKIGSAVSGIATFVSKATKLIAAFINKSSEAIGVGWNVVKGFVNGITNGIKWIANKAIEFGTSFIEGLKKFLGIHSPSAVTYEIGDNTVKGFINGVRSGLGDIGRCAVDMGKTFIDKLKNIFKKPENNISVDNIIDTSGAEKGAQKIKNIFQPIINIFNSVKKALSLILDPLSKILKVFGETVAKVFTELGRALQEHAPAIADSLANLDFDTFIKILQDILNTGLLFQFNRFLNNLNNGLGIFSDLDDKIEKIVKNFAKVLNSAKRALNGVANDLNANAVYAIAKSILVLAAAMLVLCLIPEHRMDGIMNALLKMAGVVVAVLTAIAGMSKLTGGSVANLGSIAVGIVAFSIAIFVLVGALKLMEKLDSDKIGVNIFRLVEIIGMIGLAGAGIAKAGGTIKGLLGMAIGVYLLVGAIKILANMDDSVLEKGMTRLTQLLTVIGLFSVLVGMAGKLSGGAVSLGACAAVALGVFLLSLSVMALGKQDIDTLVKGGVATVALMSSIVRMLALLGLVTKMMKGTAFVKIIGSVLSLCLGVFALAGVVLLLGSVDYEIMLQGIHGMAVCMASLVGMLASLALLSKFVSGKTTAVLLLVGVILGELIAMTLILGNMNSENATMTVIGLTAMLVGMAIMLGALALCSKFASPTLIGALAVIALIIAEFAGVIYLLSKLSPENLSNGIGSLAAIVLAIAAAIVVLGAVGSAALPGLSALSIGMLAFGAAVVLVSAGVFILAEAFSVVVDAIIRLSNEANLDTLKELVVALTEAFAAATIGILALAASFAVLLAVCVGLAAGTIIVLAFAGAISVLDLALAAFAVSFGAAAAVILGFGTAFSLMISVIAEEALKLYKLWAIICGKSVDTVNKEFGINSPSKVFANIGGYLIQGFINGIKEKWEKLKNTVKNIFKGITDFVKNIFGIHSPSKVFSEIGGYLDEGLVKGIKNYSDKVRYASGDMAQGAVDEAQNCLRGTNGLLDGLFDGDPTIRPVLDLSEVESGAKLISGMFSAKQAMALTADTNIGAYGYGSGSTINMTINGAQGQDVRELAELVSEKINNSIRRRENAWR